MHHELRILASGAPGRSTSEPVWVCQRPRKSMALVSRAAASDLTGTHQNLRCIMNAYLSTAINNNRDGNLPHPIFVQNRKDLAEPKCSFARPARDVRPKQPVGIVLAVASFLWADSTIYQCCRKHHAKRFSLLQVARSPASLTPLWAGSGRLWRTLLLRLTARPATSSPPQITTVFGERQQASPRNTKGIVPERRPTNACMPAALWTLSTHHTPVASQSQRPG